MIILIYLIKNINLSIKNLENILYD